MLHIATYLIREDDAPRLGSHFLYHGEEGGKLQSLTLQGHEVNFMSIGMKGFKTESWSVLLPSGMSFSVTIKKNWVKFELDSEVEVHVHYYTEDQIMFTKNTWLQVVEEGSDEIAIERLSNVQKTIDAFIEETGGTEEDLKR